MVPDIVHLYRQWKSFTATDSTHSQSSQSIPSTSVAGYLPHDNGIVDGNGNMQSSLKRTKSHENLELMMKFLEQRRDIRSSKLTTSTFFFVLSYVSVGL